MSAKEIKTLYGTLLPILDHNQDIYKKINREKIMKVFDEN